MVDTITVQDNGTTIEVIEVGIQGPAGATGATGAAGPQGPAGADGADGETFTNKPHITPVYGSDLIPVVRGGNIYLATIEDVLNAQGIDPPGGSFDFSDSNNSFIFAGVF